MYLSGGGGEGGAIRLDLGSRRYGSANALHRPTMNFRSGGSLFPKEHSIFEQQSSTTPNHGNMHGAWPSRERQLSTDFDKRLLLHTIQALGQYEKGDKWGGSAEERVL